MPNNNAPIDLNAMMTPHQFCAWQHRSISWFRKHMKNLPGVVREGHDVRIHPQTYLHMRLKGKVVTA